MDEIPIGLLVVDLDQRTVLLNRALEALTGYVTHEVYGVPCRYVLRSNLCGGGCGAGVVREKGGSVWSEANILNRNREKIPVRFTTAPLLGNAGEMLGFVKTVEDMRFVRQEKGDNGSFFFGNLIGNSPEMQRVLRFLPAVAQTDSSVLITGETGTGKDFIAEAIHNASPRAKGPFVKVNCGALPESLLESELFGHQKGAFTGAVQDTPGRFRLAHSGTLYLTEIGDLPLTLQVKLLSFLDDQIVHPLGSSKSIHVDVRVIAATHRDLEGMVQERLFREDLLFRLNVVRIHLPSLVDRGGDVALLLDHFLRLFASRFNKKVRGLAKPALNLLAKRRFPGNVRELRNIVEFAVNLCEGDQIMPEHLPAYVLAPAEPKPAAARAAHPTEATRPPFKADLGGRQTNWAEAERQMIMEAMINARGNKGAAAKLLGWGRNTLWRKMKAHGIIP
jgi:transcriptional regulator with PAS, ATPase and Fis domain